jgi:hypothetical protein
MSFVSTVALGILQKRVPSELTEEFLDRLRDEVNHVYKCDFFSSGPVR